MTKIGGDVFAPLKIDTLIAFIAEQLGRYIEAVIRPTAASRFQVNRRLCCGIFLLSRK
jgi:hypothetical protein